MRLKPSVLSMVTGMVLCLMLCNCCEPILYKPSADPLSILLKAAVPSNIDTLYGFSVGRMKTFKNAGGLETPNKVKEILEFSQDGIGEPSFRAEYRLYLYDTEQSAKGVFIDKRSFAENVAHNIFVSEQSERYSYFVSNVERPRSDPGGLCMPMDYYVQNAMFRFGNLIIDVRTRSEKLNTDMLTIPITYVSQKLAWHFDEGKGQREGVR